MRRTSSASEEDLFYVHRRCAHTANRCYHTALLIAVLKCVRELDKVPVGYSLVDTDDNVDTGANQRVSSNQQHVFQQHTDKQHKEPSS